MKKAPLLAVIVVVTVVLSGITGCAPMPVSTVTVAATKESKGETFDRIIDAAAQVGLPGPTKIDKENGVILFGPFGQPYIGYTAQVRVRNNGSLDVSVQLGSLYVPLDPAPKTKEFASALNHKFHVNN